MRKFIVAVVVLCASSVWALALLASPQAPGSGTTPPDSQIGKFVLFSVTYKDGTAKVMRLDTATGTTWNRCMDSSTKETIKIFSDGAEDACREDKESESCKEMRRIVTEMLSNGSGSDKWCRDEEE